MTIEYKDSKRISALSSDTKPTNVETNSILVEKDTSRRYWYDGSSWNIGFIPTPVVSTHTGGTSGTYTADNGTVYVTYTYLSGSSNVFTLSAGGGVEILLVGGGGGAGGDLGGGGGGGAVMKITDLSLSAQSHTVNVGTGGAGGTGGGANNATKEGAQGNSSIFSGSGFTSITSTGGGGGNPYNNNTSVATSGANGGGGGNSNTSTYSAGGTGTAPTHSPHTGTVHAGFDGGNAWAPQVPNHQGAGGGGAGAVGDSITSQNLTQKGAGGNGIQISDFESSSDYYYGGGGGGTNHTYGGGTGGLGGGGGGGRAGTGGGSARNTGATASATQHGGAGGANTGGGGGGGAHNGFAGGAGGSGIIVVRHIQ